MEEDLKSQFSNTIIDRLISLTQGNKARALSFTVESATSTGKGLFTINLRLNVKFEISQETNDIQEISFIVKSLSTTIKEELCIIEDNDFLNREIHYFKKVIPILQNITNVPIVNCYEIYKHNIIMEDLVKSGYESLTGNDIQVGKGLLTINHIKMVVRSVAQLHAASLDINWLHKLPYLKTDAFFEGKCREMMETYISLGCNTIIKIIQEIYSTKDTKYINWLLSKDCYEKLIEYIKPSEKYLNVLCHGDFWENNILFKSDPITNLPLDIKFIDLQFARYSTITTDLSYFLYLSCDKSFRDNHESQLLQIYVDTFNETAREERLTIEALTQEYCESRLFGAILSATMRPILLITNANAAAEGEEESEDETEHRTFGIEPDTILQHFRRSDDIRIAMTEMVDEILREMDVIGVV